MTVIVIFRCGVTLCALDRAAVSEVAPLPDLSLPPGMPASIEGFLNLGGEVIAVIDAGRLFCLDADQKVDPLYRHILIVGSDDDRIGLLVDRVEDVRAVDESGSRAPPPNGALNDCVEADITVGGETIHLLAADRILLAAEKARIADLKRAEQARLDALAST